MSPDDLAWPHLSADDCVIDGEDGIPGSIQSVDRPRATAIDYFASEAGVDFTDVKCKVGYIKLWTRQDAWDYNGYDNYMDDLVDRLSDEGKIRLDSDSLEFKWVETDSSAEPYIEGRAPKEPPEHWEPRDYDPVWEFVDKDHPRAIKVWVCETESGY